MAKKKMGGIDFKKVLLEKGERYGFYLAGGLLVLFLALGGYVASTSASSSDIVKTFDTKAATVTQSIERSTNELPVPLAPTIYASPVVPHIPFTSYAARNELFNTIANERTQRLNPRIFPPTEAQVEFVRGSVGVYDIIVGADGKPMIGVIRDRPAARNDPGKIRRIRRGGQRGTAARPTPPPNAPAAPTAPPGGMVPPGAMGGGRGGDGGRAGGLGGLGGAPAARSTEAEVQYAPLSDPAIDSAKLAETIAPHRMVVVTAAVPYKRQVEEYQRALRARAIEELTEFPVYQGFVVERQQWSADAKAMEQDWTPLDMQATLGELFAKTIDFEPENPPTAMPADTQALYPRVLPPDEFELLVPRPKLYRGEYAAVNLPSVAATLKVLKDLGQTADVQTETQRRLSDTSIFGPRTGGGQQPPGGLGGPGVGAIGAPGGRGLPGRGGEREGMRLQRPGGPGAPGGAGQGVAPATPEDAWVMRFIDVTAEPGHSYRYRVALKAKNPNYRKPAKDLAIPSFAEKETLQSGWFELPVRVAPKDAPPADQSTAEVVQVPPEEYLYAAAKDDRHNRVTEKMPTPSNWDDTWVQIQKWYDRIEIPEMGAGAVPFGEWLIQDIKAVRGQAIGERSAVPLPVWVEAQGMFLLRDNPRRTRPASQVTANAKARTEPVWTIDLGPNPQVVLVDFEGGFGPYVVPRKGLNGQTNFVPVNDSAGVEMLLMAADGKLRVARSGRDLLDPERLKREDAWIAWLKKVNEDTLIGKQRGPGDPSGGGGAGAP